MRCNTLILVEEVCLQWLSKCRLSLVCHGTKSLTIYMTNNRTFKHMGKPAPKVKPIWILTIQEMMGWQCHQLDHMQITCTSLQTDNYASTSSVDCLQAGCSSWCPANTVKEVKLTPNLQYLILDFEDEKARCPLIPSGDRQKTLARYPSWRHLRESLTGYP